MGPKKPKILFVGLNNKSAAFISHMISTCWEKYDLYIFTNEKTPRSRMRSDIHANKRGRRASQMDRKSSAVRMAGSNRPQRTAGSAHVLSKVIVGRYRRSPNIRSVHIYPSSYDLFNLHTDFSFVFFASSQSFLTSREGKTLKVTISSCSKDAAWILLSFRPNLDCLLTGSARDKERECLHGLPMNTVMRQPAGARPMDGLSVRYWYDTDYPVLIQSPFLDGNFSRRTAIFLKSLRDAGLPVVRMPKVTGLKTKMKMNVELYLRAMLVDITRRKALVPVLLHLEYQLYIARRLEVKSGQMSKKTNRIEAEMEYVRKSNLVYNAFREVKESDAGFVESATDYVGPDFFRLMTSSLQKRMLSNVNDNKSSIDVFDPVGRVSELKRDLMAHTGNSSKFPYCEQLISECDVFSQFKDVRIWVGGKRKYG